MATELTDQQRKDKKRAKEKKRATEIRAEATNRLHERRVFLTAAEERKFERLIAPLGSHVTSLAAALGALGLNHGKRRVGTKKEKPASMPTAPAPILPGDASRPNPVFTKQNTAEQQELFPNL